MQTIDDARARSVEFTATEVVVTLADGRRIATPLAWYPLLLRASAAERQNYEIMPMGIHWPDIDEDLSIAGILKGGEGRGLTRAFPQPKVLASWGRPYGAGRHLSGRGRQR